MLSLKIPTELLTATKELVTYLVADRGSESSSPVPGSFDYRPKSGTAVRGYCTAHPKPTNGRHEVSGNKST